MVPRRLSLALLPAVGGSLAGFLLQRSGAASLDWLTTLGGGVIGLAAGLGIAGIGRRRHSTFRSEADVVEALSLPVLSAIPEMDPRTQTQEPRPAVRAWLRLLLVSLAALVLWHLQL